MEFGISTACFYPRLTEVTLAEMAEQKVGCCEIFMNTLGELEPAYVKEMANVAEGSGLKICSVHPFTCAFEPFMLFTNYERRFQDGLEWHRHYFDAMNQLGAGIFVFHGDRAIGKLPEEEYFRRFARLRDLGKEYGIVVAQENVVRCRSGKLSFLCRMRDYLDGDVAFVFDNKQAVRAGLDIDTYMEAVGKQVVHVHISDNTAEADCMPLRENSPVARNLLTRLKEFSYTGAVVVELYGEMQEDPACAYESWMRLRKVADSLSE